MAFRTSGRGGSRRTTGNLQFPFIVRCHQCYVEKVQNADQRTLSVASLRLLIDLSLYNPVRHISVRIYQCPSLV